MGKRGRKAGWPALFLALVMLLSSRSGRAAGADVYFTAVNDRVLELRDETMPFRSEGVLYVPSTLFEGGDLGVSYVRNDHMGLAMLYTTKIDLRFDLEKQTASDKQGRIYSGHAIERGGIVFFPLPLVCGYFGLDWSYNQTKTVPLVRVKSESAILDDVGFIDAASWQMAGLYADYLRSTESPPEGPSAPQTPEPPPPVQAAEGQKIYLLLSSRSGEDTRRAMELLGDAQGTFLLTLEQMEDGDLIRGLTALGHGVVLRARGETEEDLAWELRRAGELLWQAACCPLELVWYEGGVDIGPLLEDAGCVPVSAGLDRREQALSSAGRAESLLRTIGQHREDLAVYLGEDGACLGGLEALLEGLEEGQYRVCAWRLTA